MVYIGKFDKKKPFHLFIPQFFVRRNLNITRCQTPYNQSISQWIEIKCIQTHLIFFPRDRWSRANCFCPVCHSVLNSETLILLITFEQWVLELCYFKWEKFSWVPLFFTLWPWPWILIRCLKTLTLHITFEQWVLERWYLIWGKNFS